MTDLILAVCGPLMLGLLYSALATWLTRRFGPLGRFALTLAVIGVVGAVLALEPFPAGAAGLPAVPGVLAAAMVLRRAELKRLRLMRQIALGAIAFTAGAVVALVGLVIYLVMR